MKWINLAERRPVDVPYGKLYLRDAQSHTKIDLMFVESDFIIDSNSKNHPNNKVEWLDESEEVKYVDSISWDLTTSNPEKETYLNVSGNTPEEENYYPNVVPDVVGELMDQPLTQQKVLKLLVDKDVECNMKLKEQHRNIRHDILEAIAKSVGGQGDMYNAIAGHISDIIKNVLETKPI